ncbi:MAG: hypothetical protein J1F38_01350 [Muribaculaceae bacterium]|nr:hypothetical protein [Muribaculaceae bacterium]
MKKVFTLLFGLAALTIATPTISAEDVYLPASDQNPDLEIIGAGLIDYVSHLISNTSSETIIGLGPVDFGDGSKFKSAFVELGRGWGDATGNIILCAGDDYNNATEVVSIPIWINDLSYQVGRPYGANIENSTVSGVQQLWLKYDGFTDNVMGVGLNESTYDDDDYIQADDKDGYWTVDSRLVGLRLRYPSQHPDYDNKKVVLLASDFASVGPEVTDGDPPHIDTANDSWGWISDGVTLEAKNVNFGDKQIQQAVFLVRADGKNDVNRFMEIYIDDKLAGKVYCGQQINNNGFLPIVANLNKTYTGDNHTVTVKYVVNGPNLFSLELFEGNVWHPTLNPDPYTYTLNEEPIESDGLLTFDFRQSASNTREDVGGDDNSKIYNEDWKCTILNTGQWEDDNVGYTNNGTVLRITDANGDAYNFGNTSFGTIVANYSTGDGSYRGPIEKSNYKLYLDLEDNEEINDWQNFDFSQVAPVAQVRVQSTGGWSTAYGVRGDVIDPSSLKGEHKLYIVLSSSDGANLKALYFEPGGTADREGTTGTVQLIDKGFTVTFDEDITLSGDENATLTVEGPEGVDVSDLTPTVSYESDVLTVVLEGYPEGAYTVTITPGYVNVGDDYTNKVISQRVVIEKEMEDAEEEDEDTSAISSIEVSQSVRYFNLSGVEISNPAKGQICIKVVNGKASKVLVR